MGVVPGASCRGPRAGRRAGGAVPWASSRGRHPVGAIPWAPRTLATPPHAQLCAAPWGRGGKTPRAELAPRRLCPPSSLALLAGPCFHGCIPSASSFSELSGADVSWTSVHVLSVPHEGLAPLRPRRCTRRSASRCHPCEIREEGSHADAAPRGARAGRCRVAAVITPHPGGAE